MTPTATLPALRLGEYLAVEEGGQVLVFPLPAGGLRIGRNPSVGLSLEDRPSRAATRSSSTTSTAPASSTTARATAWSSAAGA
jgi:hypothetical protein